MLVLVVWAGELMNVKKKGPTLKRRPTLSFFLGADNAGGMGMQQVDVALDARTI